MKIEKIYDKKEFNARQVIFEKQLIMTWKDFMEAAEKAGVEGGMLMEYIDISHGTISCPGLQVDIDTHRNCFSMQ